MNFQYWLGTEDALMQLIDTEKMVAANFVAMMDRKKAFLDEMDGPESGEARVGQYLIDYTDDGAAVVHVTGSLTNGHKWYHPFLDGGVTSYEAIADALDITASDENVSEIILSIHSGGGAVTGLDALSEKIRAADRVKPVRAHTQTAAFSAAYWIAASTREVVATRMAEVGSIGTLMIHQSVARFAREMGIDFTVFRAGKYKAIGLPHEELTDEAKEYLQADVEKANTFFLEHVSRRRNLMVSDKHRWAEGKTFFAGEAQDVGLIDRVASLEELVRASGAHQPRRNRMFISDDKRAQIAAGARPEDVLSAEELTQYKDELKNSGEGEGSEPVTIAQDKLDRIGAGEKPEDVLAEEELAQYRAEHPVEEPPAPAAGGGDLTAEYRQLLKDNGKLEARVEAAEAKAASLEERITAQQAQMQSLQEIGKLAVHNLQTALGKPKETPSSPEGLVSAYNELQGQMAERFKPGRQSQAPKDEDPQVNVPLAFRNRVNK